MLTDTHPTFQITVDGDTVNTYTQAEAVEIAKQLALKHAREIMVYDGDGKRKARIFISHAGNVHVDYYLTERIAVCDAIVHGKPRIAGTRIPVSILLEYLAQGATISELVSQSYYPDITPEDVLACIAYAGELVDLQSRKTE